MTNVIETKDAISGSWVYRAAPSSWRPYLKLARMDRPVGTWLLLWPALWSIALSSKAQWYYFDFWASIVVGFLFGLGAIVMRGAGCTYNDIVDRDFDAKVERTKSRPIPAGEVTVKRAWAFLVCQCLVGFGVLLLLSPTAQLLGFASLFLVAIYPFMKRITYWPQAWLGLTFNWGALMGWAALTNDVGTAAIALYCGGFFWTLGYDTLYAHQDTEDDALIGVKSSALALGEKTVYFVSFFYIAFLILLISAGMLANVSYFYYIGLVIAAVHLGWQCRSVDIHNGESCLRVFRTNIGFGWIVFISIIAGQFTV
ncbi:4-hydroxybenzoate octaprenyltransferase [Temperatibacter marinus]|uniref:4-hydroxybenzoate octaprenyltransferase n=1 Tax=Temperatibacter marinus TaxID=1456591 RepID=A0AA52HAZ6_9PROT|nr:4-hydroxybenzoate octaprenyltransferase [Temperatibacter marinus]WND03128.1 4-hydroxybenzoate octaprenyltransferase [Temperatibacter marinus]